MLVRPKAPTSVSYLPDLVGWGLFTQGCKLKKIGNFNLSWYREKYIWLHNSLFYNLQCYWQVLQTSTDLDQQFSAPFKAGNSRQVQTCYKTNGSNTKETATFSSLQRYRRNGSSHDLEALSVNSTTLPAFSLLPSETLPLSQWANLNNKVKWLN